MDSLSRSFRDFASSRRTFSAARGALGVVLCSVTLSSNALALGQVHYVVAEAQRGNFTIVNQREATPIYVDVHDYPGVVRAASDLESDIQRVTGSTAAIVHNAEEFKPSMILIGTLGQSAVIDRLVGEGKVDVQATAGKWESFTVQTVSNPLPRVSSALVIAGSDKRGTIYGIY